MSLVEGCGVVASCEATGDVEEGGDSGDEDAEVGYGEGKKVHVHNSSEVGSGEYHEVEEVANDANAHDDEGHHGVGDPFDQVHN